jgi:guanylate kinase
MSNKGNLIIISAPSGSGKSTLASGLFRQTKGVVFSVSHTTRKPRVGEKEGEDYFFVPDEEQFQQMIKEGAFLEHFHVYGNYYGTSRHFVESMQVSGNDVLLDIDVQGALKVKELKPEALMVFVLPPSYQELEKRLINRGLDDPEVIRHRLKIARDEIKKYKKYDYVIINNDLEKSIEDLKQIVLSARDSEKCQAGHSWKEAESVVATFSEK